MTCCDKSSEECNWTKWFYGRCMGCGNGYNKDDWKDQRGIWEDIYEGDVTWDMIVDYYTNDGFNHEGNGVCYSCATDFSNTYFI